MSRYATATDSTDVVAALPDIMTPKCAHSSAGALHRSQRPVPCEAVRLSLGTSTALRAASAERR
jgi:hypothetical protein